MGRRLSSRLGGWALSRISRRHEFIVVGTSSMHTIKVHAVEGDTNVRILGVQQQRDSRRRRAQAKALRDHVQIGSLVKLQFGAKRGRMVRARVYTQSGRNVADIINAARPPRKKKTKKKTKEKKR